MRFIFTRHGESEANVLRIISNRDLPHHLTDKRRSQVQALAELLADRRMLAVTHQTRVVCEQWADI